MNTLQVGEVIAGAVRLIALVAVGFAVVRLTRRVPWPSHPSRAARFRFILAHLALWPASVLAWVAISDAFQFVLTGSRIPDRMDEFFVIGLYFYVVVAGASYMVEAARRAARAESAAAQMQLAALRTQIQPHFLFNALHAVVQLIPIDPARASDAAELVGDLLRTTMEEERDIISLADEWTFVSRYLELERIRFGDRLRVHANIDDDLLDVRVPSYALQTLVENAIRHGAARRIEPTDIVITAAGTTSELMLTVLNKTDGPAEDGAGSAGTGLNRLRERLVALHGNAARLTFGRREDGAFEAVVTVPREEDSDS